MGDLMIKINLGFFLGVVIAMWTAHTMWGNTGMWFTFGLSLQASGLKLTIGRNI